MSRLRENSKCGFRSNNDETHVLSPPVHLQPSTSTTTSTLTSTRAIVETSSSSLTSTSADREHESDQCLPGIISDSRKNNSGVGRSDMEISIQIPQPKETKEIGIHHDCDDREKGKNKDNDDDNDNENDNNPKHSGHSHSHGNKNHRRINTLSVVVKDDERNDNDNDNDSDPPVENYNLFRLDFQDQDQDHDPEDSYQEDPDFDDRLGLNVSPMTIEEQRQQQKRRAQSQHRKRKKSATNNVDASYIPPYRKRFRRSVLPSKFLLGGNIRDPLNLASLADAKVNAALNAETPKSSPVPIPLYRHGEVPVFIPKNPDDPLGLQCEAENPYDFIAGIRKNSKARKHRNRKKGGRKRTNSECSVDKSEDSDGTGKETKDSFSSEEEKTKSSKVVFERQKSIKCEAVLPPTEPNPAPGGSNNVHVHNLKKDDTPASATNEKKKSVDVSESETSIETEANIAATIKGGLSISNSNESEPVAPVSENSDIIASTCPGPGPSSKLSTPVTTTAPEAKASTTNKPDPIIPGSGTEAATGAATSTSKKKTRHRRRMRKFGGGPGGQFVPAGFFHSAKTSDYVPLGTPSVHEPSYWYSGYTPNNSMDSYLYEVNALPFESPSLTNYCDPYENEVLGGGSGSGGPPPGMEPFSPPPKPEAKRRRIDTETGATTSMSTSTITTKSVEDVTMINTTSSVSASTTSALPSTSSKKTLPGKPIKAKPGPAIQTTTTAVRNDLSNFVRPNTPNRLLTRANFRRRFRHKADPIVSPVIPQPGCRRRFGHHGHGHGHHNHSNYNFHGHGHGHGHMRPNNSDNMDALISEDSSDLEKQNSLFNEGKEGQQENEPVNSNSNNKNNNKFDVNSTPKFRKKDEIFQYGNYNRYYGYRTAADGGDDLRLKTFPKGFFYGQDILDVGCNVGHVTLTIARDSGAKMVTGIDIDAKLIQVAKKNIKHYVDRDPADETIRFPHSCPMMYGVLQPPPGTVGDKRKIPFPYNVSFKHENYVFESDEMLNSVKPEYDIILCLSISKWVHLNYGDDGLKRFFLRAYRHLRPGGKLVLEPQPWSSYGKKKRLTERIFQTYKSIRFYPDKFPDFLLGEAGFSTVEKLATPAHHAKGFQRPLMIFTKARESDSSTQDPDTEASENDKIVSMEVVQDPTAKHQDYETSPPGKAAEAVAIASSTSPFAQKDNSVNVPVSSSMITSSTLIADSDVDFDEGAAITNTNENKTESSSATMPSSSSSSSSTHPNNDKN